LRTYAAITYKVLGALILTKPHLSL